MINKTRLLAGLALGCVLSAPAAFAEEYRGFYFGVWGGSGDMDFGSKAAADDAFIDMLAAELPLVPIQPGTSLGAIPTDSTLDDSLSPWGVQVGYRFNKWVAAEVGYVDLGELLYSSLGMLPLGPHFDLHLRGGIYYADTRVTSRLRYIDAVDQSDVFNLLHRRTDASQTELFAGLGAAWNINDSFTLRVEYQKFFDVGDDEKNGESDIDVINLAILFK
jgi:OOP family OmpA-OmpF porin